MTLNEIMGRITSGAGRCAVKKAHNSARVDLPGTDGVRVVILKNGAVCVVRVYERADDHRGMMCSFETGTPREERVVGELASFLAERSRGAGERRIA